MKQLTEAQQRIEIAKLLGWRSYPYVVCNGRRYDIETWGSACYKDFNPDRPPGGTTPGWNLMPDWPHEIQHAMDLCESMRHDGWTTMLCNGLDDTWECTFTRTKPDATVYAPGGTLALAICRGFLAVHGKWEGA